MQYNTITLDSLIAAVWIMHYYIIANIICIQHLIIEKEQ